MDPIHVLMDEHRRIEQVLYCLETYASRIARGQTPEPADLGKMVTFIREYADAAHHGKEEDMLFDEMIRSGFPKEEGPLGVMYIEHDQGRALVGRLKEAAEAAAQGVEWDEATRRTIVECAGGFVELLRAHIQKEDRILYPMAQMNLEDGALENLRLRVEAYEKQKVESGEYARLLKIAEEMMERYGAGYDPEEIAASVQVCGGMPGGACH